MYDIILTKDELQQIFNEWEEMIEDVKDSHRYEMTLKQFKNFSDFAHARSEQLVHQKGACDGIRK